MGSASSRDGSNNPEDVPLDAVTQKLYKQYMEALLSSRTINRETRDCLIRSLHFQYRFEIARLASLFRCSKRLIKRITKRLTTVRVPQEKIQSKQQFSLTNLPKLKALISDEISSKTGRITIKHLQQKIMTAFGTKPCPKYIRKILVSHLNLKWKKVSRHQPYVNSANNIKLRKVYATKLIE